MKERPMLMSAPMVRAIIAGTKTQTRRVMRDQPHEAAAVTVEHFNQTVIDRHGDEQPGPEIFGAWWADGECGIRCPYGQPGDRLWVRETFYHHGACACYRADGWTGAPDVGYEVTPAPKWKPSIHMPRAVSRITLEITGVRVERLQDISEADAIAEGITRENVIVDTNCNGGRHSEMTEDRYFYDGCDDKGFEYAVDAYAGLWESINGPGAWSANPWVWAIEFKRVTP